MLNSHSSLKFAESQDLKGLVQSLPHDIHLHLLNDRSDYSQEIRLCEWFKDTRSTVLYVPNEVLAHSAIWLDHPGLAPYRFFQPRQGFTPVLIHPDCEDCIGLSDGDVEARGWILPGDEDRGPYLDPTQPNAEDTEDSDPPVLVLSAQRRRVYRFVDSFDLDLDFGFDWQDYRRSLGWTDNYDTPSD